MTGEKLQSASKQASKQVREVYTMMSQTMGRKIDVLEHALVDSALLYNVINLTQDVIPGDRKSVV